MSVKRNYQGKLVNFLLDAMVICCQIFKLHEKYTAQTYCSSHSHITDITLKCANFVLANNWQSKQNPTRMM